MSTIFLEGSESIQQIIRSSAKKQLDSYADEWILIFEGLQNALDAVENVDSGRVRVVFDPTHNRVTIFDNGQGFPRDKEFFALGKGSKGELGDKNIRGEHGVGLKMIILCSKKFELITRNGDRLWYARFIDGFKFEDAGEAESYDEEFAEYNRLPTPWNTVIQYEFPSSTDHPTRPILISSFLQQLFSGYDQFKPFDVFLKKRPNAASLFVENYFRTHSYSGDVNRLFDNKKPTEIEVEILRDDSISEDDRSRIYGAALLEYWQNPHPIPFPCKYWDLTETFDDIEKKGFLTETHLPAFSGKKFGDSRIWVLKLTKREQFERILVNPHIQEVYPKDYFSSLLTKIRGIYVVIASASKSGRYNISQMLLGKPDQIIAADGIITTNQIRTPKRGKNQNYLNNILFVINIAERVNYGKQGVKNPKLLSKVYEFFEDSYVKTLVDLAISVAGRSAAPPPFYREPEIVITELKALEAGLSIKRVPAKEMTVVALLYELIGLGRIKNLETYQLSSIDQYDGKINLVPPKSTQFRVIKRDADLLNMEFKIYLGDLITDVEIGVKDLGEIALVVVWDATLPTGTSKYQIMDIDSSEHQGLNIAGVEEVLVDMEGHSVPILNLSRLVK
jgi:hypothetical protein